MEGHGILKRGPSIDLVDAWMEPFDWGELRCDPMLVPEDMKNQRALLTAGLFALSSLVPAAAAPVEAPADKLDQMRKDYAEAHDFLKATPRPVLGDPDFNAKLEIWSEMYTRHRELGRAMLVPLVTLAAEGPDDRFPAVRDELQGLHRELVDGPTQSSHDNLAHVSGVILPYLRDGELQADRAALFVSLTTPDDWVRGYDARTKRGVPSEPTGLLIQDVHSLALARAGEFDAARKESDLLLKKAEILLGGRLPDLRMNHGGLKRTKQSLQREFLLHRALIESLAGEEKTAREFLALAGKIAEVDQEVLNGQAPLLRQLGKLTD